jgi:hypothetical protein
VLPRRRPARPGPAARDRARRPPHHRCRLRQGRRRQIHRRRQSGAELLRPKGCAPAFSMPISTAPRSRAARSRRQARRSRRRHLRAARSLRPQGMSIGSMLTADQAVVWRGPMATSALRQLLRESDWGEARHARRRLAAGHRRYPDFAGPAGAAGRRGDRLDAAGSGADRCQEGHRHAAADRMCRCSASSRT